MNRYFRISYFQKSKLLFAMIANDLKERYDPFLVNTYLFSNNEDIPEDINSYHLLVEFKNGVELSEDLKKLLLSVYSIEDDSAIHIFDVEAFKSDIDKFMMGAYSMFSNESKYRIMYYYNIYPKNERGDIIKISSATLKAHKPGVLEVNAFFYPAEYKNEIASEMVGIIYEDKLQALEGLKDVQEIVAIYDKEKETFTKQIKI